jgi:trigger factor
MQREIRQRCGFGCVVCGMPLYEYEHMLGYAEVKRHVASEITLLCDQHHRERTNGLLPLDDVKRADANPYNKRTGVSKPYDFHFHGSECEALIGGNLFTTRDAGHGTIMVPISVDGIPIVGFVLSDGRLLLNLRLFDEYNQVVLRIDNNSLTYRPDTWDIQLVGRRLTIREAHRNLLLDIVFNPPNKIWIERGRLLCNGVEVAIFPDHIMVNGMTEISGCLAERCSGGLLIGCNDPPLSGFFAMSHISRYPDRGSVDRANRT